MKKFLLLIALALCSFAFSQESKNTDWEFYTTTDFAYYLKSAYIPGRDHFSPVSGPYDGIGFRSSFSADYTKEIPLGTHPLLSNSKIIFTPGIELSPITFSLKLSTTFEPVPFYQFSAGGTLGTGWNFSTLSGLKLYNFNTNEYENPNYFSNLYYELWFQNVLMFDTGYLIPGDWTHVVFQFKSKIIYTDITDCPSNTIYSWQQTINNATGLKYDNTLIIGYQLPFKLYRTGIISEFTGHFDPTDYNIFTSTYKGKFTTITVAPFWQFRFSDKDSLDCMIEFSNRRSFYQDHTSVFEELNLNYSGKEWFLNRIGFSWFHKF